MKYAAITTLRQTITSIRYFIALVFSRSLHTRRQHLGTKYKVSDEKTYTVFLETVSDKQYGEEEVTLIIGFRLKLIDNNKYWHWLFQHVCILDVPIWVGFRGFKTKYWLEEPVTNDYLGIYRYQGKTNAKKYAEYICSVLRPLSTPGSLWYEIVDEAFVAYTESHRQSFG